MNLTIDIGNTLQKIGLFEEDELVEFYPLEQITIEDLEQLFLLQPGINASILSSVADYDPQIRDFLNEKGFFIEFSTGVPVPVKNRYATPETLGYDRIAAAIAGSGLFPGKDCLVIQAGTCITYEFTDSDKNYHGGAISPGIDVRLKALHTFTDNLPLLERKDDAALIGDSTETSILSGVLNGVVAEMDALIARYQNIYPGLQVILSGGDMNYFDKRLKNNIFALPNIVLKGLNIILKYNFES